MNYATADMNKLEKELIDVNGQLKVQSSSFTTLGNNLTNIGNKLKTVGDRFSSVGSSLTNPYQYPSSQQAPGL